LASGAPAFAAPAFGAAASGAVPLATVERVAGWVRERFSLPPGSAVLVSELACAVPGCPPLETVLAFWTGDPAAPRRHHYKVFKPLAQVLQDDLPPYWMKDALAAAPDFGCDCC
jgi:nitrate reductase delta subunit